MREDEGILHAVLTCGEGGLVLPPLLFVYFLLSAIAIIRIDFYEYKQFSCFY